ncbi:MAG TPA: RDD family protein [Terriglobales bacterium]|nr:RDD family protein [Terriglobales bacterium]
MDCPVGGDTAVHPDAPADLLASAPGVEDAATEVDAQPQSSGVDADYWRHEVASRLERYRARRKPRAPRYPSLRLPFDSADSWAPVSASALAVSASAPDRAPAPRTEQNASHLVEPRPVVADEAELFTNVIEFPRYAAVPVHHANELAEPIFERPRIVEAPEVLPPPPALGGMLMEPARNREPERRTAADLTLNPASLPRRMLAGLFDTGILLAALAGFGGIFVWMNAQRPPLAVVGMAIASISVILWAAYEFLFTVYTGSTPGLRLARLKLVKFDGSEPSRRLRRWRVLASYLSAFALGLGYLWSVLDEDGLCWHDRITRTHLI